MGKQISRQRGMILGKGVNDLGSPKDSNDPSKYVCYITWVNMIKRCYDTKFACKIPTYHGCEICDEWLVFSNFKKWYDANHIEGYEIDKDVLCRYYGMPKYYSPQTCRFVPHYLNSAILLCNGGRGKYPIGVSFNKLVKKFECHICNGKEGRINLGLFTNPMDAFAAYQRAFRKKVNALADNAYKQGIIDSEYCQALKSFDVSIID